MESCINKTKNFIPHILNLNWFILRCSILYWTSNQIFGYVKLQKHIFCFSISVWRIPEFFQKRCWKISYFEIPNFIAFLGGSVPKGSESGRKNVTDPKPWFEHPSNDLNISLNLCIVTKACVNLILSPKRIFLNVFLVQYCRAYV